MRIIIFGNVVLISYSILLYSTLFYFMYHTLYMCVCVCVCVD